MTAQMIVPRRRPKGRCEILRVVQVCVALVLVGHWKAQAYVMGPQQQQQQRGAWRQTQTRLQYGPRSDIEVVSDHSSYLPDDGEDKEGGRGDGFVRTARMQGEQMGTGHSKTSRHSPSLAELESMEEERLDHDNSTQTSPNSKMVVGNLDDGAEDEEWDRSERQRQIKEILAKEDVAYKEERRKMKLGEFYAQAETKEDFARLEQEARNKIAKENEVKAQIAAQSGITLQVLEPSDAALLAEQDPASNFMPDSVLGKQGTKSWFDQMDKEIEAELTGMFRSQHSASSNLDADESDYDGMSVTDEDGPRIINGRVVSKDELQGVSVGSAGGWKLEVFPGDFVVHRKYGIGRFEKTVLKPKTKLTDEEKHAKSERRKELVQLAMKEGKDSTAIQEMVKTFGTEKDTDTLSNPLVTLLEIAYADAVVHVPVDRAYRLSRYRAGDAVIKPRLSRVKGEAWSKAKNKVEANTIQMAQDVLALYATRETLNRSPFQPSKEMEVKTFEKTFTFEPTPDQVTCFENVENDMVWRNRPMDRLVCGDVGFGKTEVAMRALFRAVVNGRQCALLAPTGVLAAQHYKTVVKRMGPDTPFNISVTLLRGGMGKNTKTGREIRGKIADGSFQLIVGTHALLGNDLQFQDLGLLVVDEEQRFGVKQKERLKLICNGVDVLTLSATPIPRTLQMSLSGIRDTSTIRSPPPMRKATKSFVTQFDNDVIRDAIRTELERDGQIFYVVPRIAQLEEAEKMIRDLFPDIRVIQAHGRQTSGTAENNVAAFAEGNFDVLLATTVIENGVDIPRVNTIIIQNAQSFGMSTLYQLRGRVGRSDVQAFAYFLHKTEAITEQSAMRLQAMADLHELGSGFDVANRDLEIRGAGSLLGTEQSGLAAKVGFDLYMRMLKKSIRQLRGLDLPAVLRTNILLPGNEGSIEVGTYAGSDDNSFKIPEKFIPDFAERVKEEGEARLAESTAKLVELTNYWKKTYGNLPTSLQSELKKMHLHACTRQLGIDLVGMQDNGEGRMDCVLRSPGLRPRHWAYICSVLPKGLPTKGLDVVFPARFVNSGEDATIEGGKSMDLKSLLSDQSGGEEEEEWDALDQEEGEAMKQIASAMTVKNLDDIDIEEYPRFIIKDLGSVKEGTRVGALLKVLLPATKVVFEKQESDKEKAKVAHELREKREAMKKQKKENDSLERRRMGYAMTNGGNGSLQ